MTIILASKEKGRIVIEYNGGIVDDITSITMIDDEKFTKTFIPVDFMFYRFN